MRFPAIFRPAAAILYALAPELGIVPAAEGVPVREHQAQLLPFAATGIRHHTVGAAHPVLPCAPACCPVRWQLAISREEPLLETVGMMFEHLAQRSTAADTLTTFAARWR